jgi:hypothetical protein
LSAAGVTARYPDPDDPPYELDEVGGLIADADRVIAAVRKRVTGDMETIDLSST